MVEHTIMGLLTQYPCVIIGLPLLALGILLLPYELERTTRASRTYRRWRSSLWTWTHTPRRTRLYLDGLRQAQQALLWLGGQLWRQARGDLLACLWEHIRRWLGW